MQPRSIDDSPGSLPGESIRTEARSAAERTADLCRTLGIPDDWLYGDPDWRGRIPVIEVAWDRIPELLSAHPDSHGDLGTREGASRMDVLIHLHSYDSEGVRTDLATVLSSSPLLWRGRINFGGPLGFGGAR